MQPHPWTQYRPAVIIIIIIIIIIIMIIEEIMCLTLG